MAEKVSNGMMMVREKAFEGKNGVLSGQIKMI